MKTKHTPGPWRVGKKNRIETEQGVILISENEITSRSLDNHYQSAEERDANATLIASAPELLLACKRAQELIRAARQYFPKSIRNSDTFNLENTNATIGKAIHKAEGTAE